MCDSKTSFGTHFQVIKFVLFAYVGFVCFNHKASTIQPRNRRLGAAFHYMCETNMNSNVTQSRLANRKLELAVKINRKDVCVTASSLCVINKAGWRSCISLEWKTQ